MRRLAGLTLVLALAALLVASLVRQDSGGGDAADGLPREANRVVHAGDSVREFRTLGELAATSAAVVQADVVEVQQGTTVRLGDTSRREIVPRLLVLKVQQVLYVRSTARLPEQIRVNDGYWESGDGYAREGLPWAQPGDTGYYFLSQDRGPDGNPLPTYSLLSPAGRVLVHGNRAEHVAHPVWQSAGPSQTPQDVAEAVASAVQAARDGKAKPVLITACHPSVPGDENSEPICVEE